jgi:nucleoside-diphosphate-sugar epimerase
MRILVTGGAGYIGSHMVKLLAEKFVRADIEGMVRDAWNFEQRRPR